MMWKVDPLFGHHNFKPGNEVKRNFWHLNRCAEVPDSLKCNPDLRGRSYAESSICAHDRDTGIELCTDPAAPLASCP
jgi:hypothetical protein